MDPSSAPFAPRLCTLPPPPDLCSASSSTSAANHGGVNRTGFHIRPANGAEHSSFFQTAQRIRPMARNPRSVSLPESKETAEAEILERSSPPMTVYYTLHANGYVQKRTSQRPSSSCFGFKFRIPNRGELIFHSYATPSNGMEHDDKVIYTCMGLNRYFEKKGAEYCLVRKCLMLGCPSPVTPIYLSYILHEDCIITLGELPGVCTLTGQNTKANCKECVRVDIAELPWDEDDFGDHRAVDLVVLNTASFLGPSITLEQATHQIHSYCQKLIGPETKMVVGHHKQLSAFWMTLQKMLHPEFQIIEHDSDEAQGAVRDIRIFFMRRRTQQTTLASRRGVEPPVF